MHVQLKFQVMIALIMLTPRPPVQFAHVQTLAAQASEASTSVGGRGGRYESSTTKTIPWLEEDRTKKYPRGRKVGTLNKQTLDTS